MARIAALHTPVYRYAHAQYPQVEYASEAELQATYGPLRAADIIGYEYCANCDRGIIGTKTDDDDLEHNYPCYTARIVQGG